MPDYPFLCTECGRTGTEDDLCELGGECPDEDCDGTIIANPEATPMTDSEHTYRAVCAIDTPPRQRAMAALELLVHLAKHGELTYTPDERIARAEVCKAVLLSELDSYQTLLLRLEG